MSDPPSAWTLDRDAFEELLAFFDRDRDLAARKYEDVRRRLVKLFAWRGCAAPDEYADRTIDRVARKLQDGGTLQPGDSYRYFHGVAINVLREHWREPERAWTSIDRNPRVNVPSVAADVEPDPHREQHDRRMSCLDACLERLPVKTRDLLLDYHAGERHIEHRQTIAQSLGIGVNALRIRVHRVRQTVEACVQECLTAEAR